MSGFIHRHRLLLLSLLTGLLLSLGWPARGFPFLTLFALVPLLWVEDQLLKHRDRHRAISILWLSWLAFLVFNLCTTWWIWYASAPGMLVAMVLNALFMAIPVTLMHLARRVLPGRQGQASLLFFWLSFEYLHARWDLSWSWLDLGNAFAAYPSWVQWYEYTGVAGGTAWILAMNLLLFSAHKQYAGTAGSTRRLRILGVLSLLVFAVPPAVSFFLWGSYEEKHDPVEVVVVQPSIDPYDRARTPDEVHRRVRHMIGLAEAKTGSATRFVVAPEGANPQGIWMHQAEDNPMVQAVRYHVDQHADLTWVFGSMVYRRYGPSEPAPRTARQDPGSSLVYDVFNSAVMVEAGQPPAYYHKSKLVPGIEKMPFYQVLQPVGRLVERFGGTAGSLGVQDHRGVFSAGGHAAAPVVCYESVYGDYMREYYYRGAGLVFIITNDGWWRNTPGHRQHNQYARLRAIEARRSIARAASTGISSFINQRGEVLEQSAWWEPVAMVHTLNQNHHITYFVLHGNYLGKLGLFLSFLLILYMASRRLMHRENGMTGSAKKGAAGGGRT
jgi:apolipoprotein N-acyltransferase